MIKFNVEDYTDCIDEIKPMLSSHYSEVEFYQGRVQLNPNFEVLEVLDQAGLLFICTMRDEGKLVGYNVFSVGKAMHYKDHDYATNYTVYIDPEYRHTEETVYFFNFCEEYLKGMGVSIIQYQMKTHKTFSTLMNHLGFENTESIFTKYVGQE